MKLIDFVKVIDDNYRIWLGCYDNYGDIDFIKSIYNSVVDSNIPPEYWDCKVINISGAKGLNGIYYVDVVVLDEED